MLLLSSLPRRCSADPTPRRRVAKLHNRSAACAVPHTDNGKRKRTIFYFRRGVLRKVRTCVSVNLLKAYNTPAHVMDGVVWKRRERDAIRILTDAAGRPKDELERKTVIIIMVVVAVVVVVVPMT